LSGLKPGPISEARAKANADAKSEARTDANAIATMK
jgi:hypothetical protein